MNPEIDAPRVSFLSPAKKARIAKSRAHCRDTKHGGRCYSCGSQVDRWDLTELDLDRACRLPESVNFRCDEYGQRNANGTYCDYCTGFDE